MIGWLVRVGLLLAAGTAIAAEIPEAADLVQDGRTAQRQGAAILLFFTSSQCSFCEQVEDLYLRPMFERAPHGERLLLRRVSTTAGQAMRDFNGRDLKSGEFAGSEGIRLTPTVRLYGTDGRQLVSELVGYSSPHFYAGQLDQTIADALEKLRANGAR
jgi:thioredoxin-related protein